MAIQRWDLAIDQKSNTPIPSFIYEDNFGVVYNITGWGCRMYITDQTGALLLFLTVGSGITVDGPNGKISIAIDAVTANFTISPGNVGRYQIYLDPDVIPSVNSFRFVEGSFRVFPSIV